jgi:hypothetical protein
LAYEGSLVGATKEVDHSSLHRADYVRIKITAKDVSKIPEVAEGAILPYLYDFNFEREVECSATAKESSLKINGHKEGDSQPSPKNPRVEDKSVGQSNLQLDVYSAKTPANVESNEKHKVSEVTLVLEGSSAASGRKGNVSTSHKMHTGQNLWG